MHSWPVASAHAVVSANKSIIYSADVLTLWANKNFTASMLHKAHSHTTDRALTGKSSQDCVHFIDKHPPHSAGVRMASF